MLAVMMKRTNFVMAAKGIRAFGYIEDMAGNVEQIVSSLGFQRVGYARPLLEVAARQWSNGAVQERAEQIVEETPVVIVYNAIPHVVMMATPADLEDFVLGFSITEELIRTP